MNPTLCPICGESPVIELSAVANGTFVCTHDCQESPQFYLELSSNFESADAAESAWNRLMSQLKNQQK